MANLISGTYYLVGDIAKSVEAFKVPKGICIYEVLRVIQSVPLFWEEHFERFRTSAKLAEVELELDQNEFATRLKKLIQLNGISEGNIKIDFYTDKSYHQALFYFIPHSYPTRENYSMGVPVGLIDAERTDPGAKIVQARLREKANQLIRENNYFEVLLVNRDGQITEGSRTNVFFTRGSQFFTPPEYQVLNGITRQKVATCIRLMGKEPIEKEISIENINTFDGAFLTGTSPKILPIRSIGDISFKIETGAVAELIQIYDQLIQENIRQNYDFFSFVK